jgi:hypothetical protein
MKRATRTMRPWASGTGSIVAFALLSLVVTAGMAMTALADVAALAGDLARAFVSTRWQVGPSGAICAVVRDVARGGGPADREGR